MVFFPFIPPKDFSEEDDSDQEELPPMHPIMRAQRQNKKRKKSTRRNLSPTISSPSHTSTRQRGRVNATEDISVASSILSTLSRERRRINTSEETPTQIMTRNTNEESVSSSENDTPNASPNVLHTGLSYDLFTQFTSKQILDPDNDMGNTDHDTNEDLTIEFFQHPQYTGWIDTPDLIFNSIHHIPQVYAKNLHCLINGNGKFFIATNVCRVQSTRSFQEELVTAARISQSTIKNRYGDGRSSRYSLREADYINSSYSSIKQVFPKFKSDMMAYLQSLQLNYTVLDPSILWDSGESSHKQHPHTDYDTQACKSIPSNQLPLAAIHAIERFTLILFLREEGEVAACHPTRITVEPGQTLFFAYNLWHCGDEYTRETIRNARIHAYIMPSTRYGVQVYKPNTTYELYKKDGGRDDLTITKFAPRFVLDSFFPFVDKMHQKLENNFQIYGATTQSFRKEDIQQLNFMGLMHSHDILSLQNAYLQRDLFHTLTDEEYAEFEKKIPSIMRTSETMYISFIFNYMANYMNKNQQKKIKYNRSK